MFPCPGLPGWVSRSPIPGSRPNPAKDGPSNPGETPLPVLWYTARRQGQVSLLLCLLWNDREHEVVYVYVVVWLGHKWRQGKINRAKQWKWFRPRTFEMFQFLQQWLQRVREWNCIILLYTSFLLPLFSCFFHFSFSHFSPVCNYFSSN